jgi:hypothetical protein
MNREQIQRDRVEEHPIKFVEFDDAFAIVDGEAVKFFWDIESAGRLCGGDDSSWSYNKWCRILRQMLRGADYQFISIGPVCAGVTLPELLRKLADKLEATLTA